MKKKIALFFAFLLLIAGLSGCAGLQRLGKSITSNVGNGLHREVTVTLPNGEVVYHDEGKFDIEVNDYRIKYIDEKGNLQIVYPGSSTAVVSEK